MGVGVGVAVLTMMVPKLAAITVGMSNPKATTPALPPRNKFRGMALRCPHSLSQRPAPVVIDVDAASNSTPLTHLLSEGDIFPTDTEAALKHETKP